MRPTRTHRWQDGSARRPSAAVTGGGWARSFAPGEGFGAFSPNFSHGSWGNACSPPPPGPTVEERFVFHPTCCGVLENFLEPDPVACLLTALERASGGRSRCCSSRSAITSPDITPPGHANLTVVPGSHKARQLPSLNDLEAQHEWPGAVQVCAPAGTAILFHNALFHSGAPYAAPAHCRTMLYYAYEHPWMIGAQGHWGYSKEFYNRRLSAAQRKQFHGFVFDPPEQRWG